MGRVVGIGKYFGNRFNGTYRDGNASRLHV